jgi:hypothetical protein
MHQNMHQARAEAKDGNATKEGVEPNLLILIGLLWCREGGVEPPRPCDRRILSLSRIP